MVFTNRHNIEKDLNIKLNGVNIDYTDRERFLGVIMDSRLSWNSHINTLSSKISRNAGIIYRLKGLVPESVLRNLYNSFIQSHLNYCSSVWGLGTKSSLNKLFTSQKKSVRAIENRYNNCYYNPDTGELPCHTKDIFSRNNILTVHNLIAKNCLIFMQKVYLNISPKNILQLFSIVNENRPRREPTFFKVPYSRIKSLDKTLAFRGPSLYNSIINCLNLEYVNSENRELQIERHFLNPFKTKICRYLSRVQERGDKEWDTCNFVLYN